VAAASEAVARAGFKEAAFVFARTSTLKPPPRSKVDDELDKIEHGDDSSEKASQFAKLIQDIAKPCPALIEAFGRVAAIEGDKATYIIQQVQPSLIDCDCKADIPALRSALWRLLANSKPTTDIRITLDRAAPKIAFPDRMPWREAGKRLAAGATTGWLVVSP
jgi:hypothetical protein